MTTRKPIVLISGVTQEIPTGDAVALADTSTNLAGGSGGTIPYQTASGATAMLANGTVGQVLQSNGTTTAPSWVTSAAGNALTSNPLSQFAATTSAQLAGVMSDETGSGALVFATSPTLVTPVLGTPASGVLTNCTGYTDANLSLSNITTNNVSISAHGFAPILPNNAAVFLNGQGNYATPSTSAIPSGTFQQGFSAVSSIIVTHNLGSYPNVQVIDNSASPAVLIPLTITHNSVNQLTVTFATLSTGTVLLTSGSPPLQAIIDVSGTYTVLSTDVFVNIITTGVTVTMPDATVAANKNKIFYILSPLNGTATVATTSSQTINGDLTKNLVNGAVLALTAISGNWRVI